MGNIVVYLQHQNGKIIKASLCALTGAQTLKTKWGKGSLIGVCLGAGAGHAADDALRFGFSEVYFSEAPALSKYMAPAYARAIVECVKASGADTVVAAATSTGKDCMPRVAAYLDAAQASDVLAVNDDGTVRRPMYAGDVLADVELTTPMRVVTVRSSGFPPAATHSAGGVKKEVPLSLDTSKYGEVVSYEISKAERPELGDAEVVVSGGRALQSAANFERVIFPLADAFGAAVGASRAAVDSGYAPNDWQVGQTGKVVAPNLYVAVGISGAIQHLAGMKDSKVIVAINKDPDAPIFEVADYGLVGDLYQIVPELTDLIKRAKAG